MNRRNGLGNRPRGQRGYTLLEVLIAFTLLAIGLGILLAILSDGVHAIGRASESTQATLYAQGLLDSLGADRRLQPGRSQGQFRGGRYRWTLDIAPEPTPAAAPVVGVPAPTVAGQGSSENVLLHVVLQVRWGSGSGEVLRVDTLRAYAPAQDVQP